MSFIHHLRRSIALDPLLSLNSPHRADVYITSNEEETDAITEKLTKHPEKGDVYLGVSGLLNWDFIAARSPDLALLTDYNQNVVDLQNYVIEALKVSATPDELIRKIYEKIQLNPEMYRKNFRVKPVKGEPLHKTELSRLKKAPLSIFSSRERFLRVKNLVLKNRVIAFSLDFTSREQVSHLNTLLKTHNCALSTLYISNAMDWVHADADDVCTASSVVSFKENLSCLKSAKTLIIDSSWYGRALDKYPTSFGITGKQIVANLIYPHPWYDPCILRGSVSNPVRQIYFSKTKGLLPLDQDVRSQHKSDVSLEELEKEGTPLV